MIKQAAIICDIDGTIANIGHRMKYWRQSPRDYHSFYKDLESDSPIINIIEAVNVLSNAYHVIYLTGRHEGVRRKTIQWLERNNLPAGKLIMKPDTCFDSDVEFKRSAYFSQISKTNEIILVFEDRIKCVNMWREIGLTCLQVAEGNY